MTTSEERAAADNRPVMLPFYLLIDVSGSMGSLMSSLNGALQDFRDGLSRDPVLSDKVLFSIIDFSDDAQVRAPLGDLTEGQLPVLSPRGGTSFAAAFDALRNQISRDVENKSQGVRYFRPAAFFLTDGFPNQTDPWQKAFAELTAYDSESGGGFKSYPLFIPFGIGEADRDLLLGLCHPPKRSRLYMAKDGVSAGNAIKQMLEVMLMSTLATSQSNNAGRAQHVVPTQEQVGDAIEAYDGGDYVG